MPEEMLAFSILRRTEAVMEQQTVAWKEQLGSSKFDSSQTHQIMSQRVLSRS